MPKRILVTVPNTGNIHVGLLPILMELGRDPRYKLCLWFPNHRPLENNQHHIINRFAREDFDFWLSIDSDTVPMENPLNLVEYDRDIIGLPYPVPYMTRFPNTLPYYWAAYDYDKKTDDYTEHNAYPDKGLQPVDAIGGGCFLVARRVFLNPSMQTGAFTRKKNPDGTVRRGNDISFCERARDAGFEIFSHFDYPCRHHKRVEMVETIRAYEAAYG